MNDDAANLSFENRKAFRYWLEKNHGSSDGIWIILDKGSKKLTANEALEEAICYGWIDGTLKSIDSTKYKKYFSKRKDKANWSDKNKSIYKRLKEEGLITKYGIAAYQVSNEVESDSNKVIKNENNITTLKNVLKNQEDVFKLFEDASPSRQKQLSGFYCEAKTEETREKERPRLLMH